MDLSPTELALIDCTENIIWMLPSTDSFFPLLPLSSHNSQIQELFQKYIPE